ESALLADEHAQRVAALAGNVLHPAQEAAGERQLAEVEEQPQARRGARAARPHARPLPSADSSGYFRYRASARGPNVKLEPRSSARAVRTIGTSAYDRATGLSR